MENIRKIRKGKDVVVKWPLYRRENGERVPYIINPANAKLRVMSPLGEIQAKEVKFNNNVVEWTFRGSEQEYVGNYTLIFVENDGQPGMVTVDTCKAFALVAHSCEETPDVGGDVVTEAVMLEGDVAFAPVVIEVGSAYDDTELREMIEEQDTKLTELSAEVNEVAEKINNINPTPMVSVTYAELVALRDNGELVAGSYYRITDYITTTAQENTQSANHPFDVIVLALSENTIAEEAYAIQSARDTDGYFANSNLAAWKLWYSLDNDTERFAWADEENGKGVICRMIDEWNNDIPYDFKNIQFKRSLIFENGYAEFSESGEETWVYTFAGQSYHINNDEWSGMVDGSLESPSGHMSDENTSTFHDNTIKPYIVLYNGNDIYAECGLRYLNDIVFLGYWEKIGSANEEDMPYYYAFCCHSNSFNYNCHSNSFNYNCYGNSFGNDCYFNSFGNYCYFNSFGNGCCSNSFGNDCSSNSFGNYCNSNSFGNSCYSNSFGNYCYYNSFGNDCYHVELSEHTIHQTASVSYNGDIKMFNLADLADLLKK